MPRPVSLDEQIAALTVEASELSEALARALEDATGDVEVNADELAALRKQADAIREQGEVLDAEIERWTQIRDALFELHDGLETFLSSFDEEGRDDEEEEEEEDPDGEETGS